MIYCLRFWVFQIIRLSEAILRKLFIKKNELRKEKNNNYLFKKNKFNSITENHFE